MTADHWTAPGRRPGGHNSAMARFLIGTSGWHYKSWQGSLYPKDVMLKDHLRYYASQFRTTELNGFFYRTPTTEAVKSWRRDTGEDFIFAWNASKAWRPVPSMQVCEVRPASTTFSIPCMRT